ncbi:MAG: LytTR family transcriptional regulator DNA-binding domain-containing protein [Lachnospiraceae bacterium]|nr:LytTR family transcriptional regulator DNA-binding domain-containing protein [Lachnospiraceae bacterium]
MKLNLYKDKNLREEKVDIHYTAMRPMIRQLIDTVRSERPSLSGRPADEDVDDGEEIILDTAEIYYLDHVDRKLFAYTKDGVFRIAGTLSDCEEMLWNYGFVRVSKSNLINIYKVKQLKPDVNMKVYASFDNGERICVNRSYNKSFREYLQKMRRMSL